MSSMPDLAEHFPPLITPVRLREREDAFAHAIAHAAEAGAGTLFHVGRFDPIEFALVLEPEDPLLAARRMMFCGMNALAETIAAEALPERLVEFDYPGDLIFDHGLIGGARLAWPEDCAEDAVPDWLVFGAMVRTGSFQELGFAMDHTVTSLEEAGFKEIDPTAFAARFCRHLMIELDEWQHVGFSAVGERYLRHLRAAEQDGTRRIAPSGNLSVHNATSGTMKTFDLAAELRAARWYDPALLGPRL